MLHSASNNATGVPDQLQQKHQEEQRKKDAQQAMIQVILLSLEVPTHPCAIPSCHVNAVFFFCFSVSLLGAHWIALPV